MQKIELIFSAERNEPSSPILRILFFDYSYVSLSLEVRGEEKIQHSHFDEIYVLTLRTTAWVLIVWYSHLMFLHIFATQT